MNYAYTYTYTPLFSMILPILALLLILASGIALYTLFVRKPNHYHGAAAKLHDFLNFRHAYTEGLLKILYCMTVAALAVYSVILLFFHFFWAILLFIVGNIAARLGYEFIMMLFSMHRTLRSIDRKMPEPQPLSSRLPHRSPSRRIHRKIRSRPISRNTDRCFRLKFVQRRLQKHASHDKIDILLQNFAAGPTHVLPYKKEYLRKRRSVH